MFTPKEFKTQKIATQNDAGYDNHTASNSFQEKNPDEYEYQDDIQMSQDTTAFVSNEKPVAYEGIDVKDLSEIGFQTITLLKVASKNIIDKTRFNIPFLEATPLKLVIECFSGKQIGENLYLVLNQEISLKENKWYNLTLRKGHVNAISLTKHLLSISENVDEYENQKTLFIAACKNLTSLQQDIQNLKEVSEQPEFEAPTEKAVTKVSNSISSNVNTVKDNSPPVVQNEPTNNTNSWSNSHKKIDWKALTDQLNSIPLSAVMEYVGASPNEDNHKGQWKIWSTAHNVQVTGNQWYDYNAQRGAVGAISFLAFHLGIINNLDDRNDDNKKALRKMAIKELMKEFGSDFDISSLGGAVELNLKQPFSMPHVIDFKINDVRNYLNQKRGLPLWIINKQIATGNLFAGFPSDWKPNQHLKNPDKLQNEHVWAVFLAMNGNAAEMRGIDRYDNYAKILATGSDKDTGGFLLKAERDCTERTVTALEASIDAMSYHSFYPGRVATSCMGVNFNLAVSSALEAFNAGYKFQLGFDNDLAGNEAAVRFKEKLIEELGEEEYKSCVDKEQIKFFDLGIKVLKETVQKNEIFYFDVKNNDAGREAVAMFQEQLLKSISKEEIKSYLNKGKIKYINVCPAFGMIQDPKLEARQVVDLLESGKPYYLRIRTDEDEVSSIREKRISFENAVMEIAKDKMSNWEKDGRMIYTKDAIAKDWNELFLYMKTKPEFVENLKQQENQYIHYSKKPEEKKESKNSMNKS